MLDRNQNIPLSDESLMILGGGDGTIASYGIQAARNKSASSELGFLPLGTGNDLCRSLGITAVVTPDNVGTYLSNLVAGTIQKLDVWQCTQGEADFCFVNYLSLGLDSYVVQSFAENDLRNIWPYRLLGKTGNRLAYGIEAMKHSRTRLSEIKINTTGLTKPISGLLLSNIWSYMGLATLETEGSPFDGKLECALFGSPFSYLRAMLPWLPAPRVEYRGSDTVWRIAGLTSGIPIQCDGEFAGVTSELEMEVKLLGKVSIRLPGTSTRSLSDH